MAVAGRPVPATGDDAGALERLEPPELSCNRNGMSSAGSAMTGAGAGSGSGSGSSWIATGSGVTTIGSVTSGSVDDEAVGSNAGASLRAMALPGANAWTFSNSSAGNVGMPGSGCSSKISTALPKCCAAVAASPFS
jgi:hypothetical protein